MMAEARKKKWRHVSYRERMEEMANKRAESMIDARKRHFEDLLIKKNHYYNMAI